MATYGLFQTRNPGATPPSDDVRQELDAIVLESLAPIAATLACFYGLLTILHIETLPLAISSVMSPLSAGSAVLCFLIKRTLRKNKWPASLAYGFSFAILFLVLINSAVHMWLTRDIEQSTNFALIFVAVGLFFLTPRYIAVAYGIIFSTWLSLALSLSGQTAEIVHFGIMNAQAIVIGYLSYFLRVRVNRRLIKMRSEALVREADLAQALDKARLYAEAEKENKAKTAFLANMSHELRTPLNAILGFSEIMKEQAFGPHSIRKYHEYSQDIHTAGDHLLSLVNDILDLSRIELHAQDFSVQPIDLNRACENCITIVRQHAERGHIELTYEPQSELPVLYSDERRFKQVLTNLLSNAIKFTPPGGRIELDVRAMDDDRIRIRVTDSGIGMSADDLSHATKPFWQAEVGLDRAFEGTGLGLALVTEMLKVMKGELTLESEPRKGTVATVLLPISTPLPTRVAEASVA